MAAPATLKIEDLSGKYVMNKTLSDDFVKVLTLQGVGWLTKKAIGLATVTLSLKHYTSPKPDSADPPHKSWGAVPPEFGKDGLEHIDTEQSASGIPGTTELRILDGEKRENEDHVFGKYEGVTIWGTLGEVEDDFAKEGWLPETAEGKLIIDRVNSRTRDWVVEQVWGFADINGERRFVRRTVAKAGKKADGSYKDVVRVRLVYDYAPL